MIYCEKGAVLLTLRKFLQRWTAMSPATLIYIIAVLILYLIITLFIDVSLTYCLILEAAIILFSIVASLIEIREDSPDFESRLIGKAFKDAKRTSKTFRKAFSLLHSGDLAGALDYFNELKNEKLGKHERAVLCFYLGRCYEVMGYPTNAAKFYRESLDSDIGIDEVYLIAARAYTSNGSFAEAEEVYDSLLSRDTKLENIYTDLGMVYIKANNPDKALETFSKALKLHHNYSFALGGCALAYLLKSDTVNARFFFSQAIINNIDDSDGFTEYYCSVAESKGLGEEIGIKPRPKLYFDPSLLRGDREV
jgi:tetratricopeptide (TPR) repeat protein